MKNIQDVLLQKEFEIARVKKEIEALRAVVPMLADEETAPEIFHSLAKSYSAIRRNSEPVRSANTGTTAEIIW